MCDYCEYGTIPATDLLEIEGVRYMSDDYGRDDEDRIELPVTWGDYCGDVYNRANAEVLGQCYGPHLRTYHGMYYSEITYVDANGRVPAELAEDLRSLSDYPLLDDDALTHLEQRMAEEDMDSWVLADVRRALPDPEDYALPPIPGEVDLDDDAVLANLIWDHVREWPEGPYAETATTLHWPYLDDTVASIREQVEQGRQDAWDEYARTYRDIPGQLVLV